MEQMAEHGDAAKLLAGGQSLIPAMNFRVLQPSVLIDLNRIESLDYIESADDGTLLIGAMTRQRDIERSQDVERIAPLLHEAMPHIAHPQIRTRGTLGGSLAHADPAAELPVIVIAAGARMRRTRITQEFDYAAFRDRYEDRAILMFIVSGEDTERCRVAPVTTEVDVTPRPGQSVICLVDPDD